MSIKNFNHVLEEQITKHNDRIEMVAELIGTPKFAVYATLFFFTYFAANIMLGLLIKWAPDPSPFLLLSTGINLYGFYTASLVGIAERARAEREKLKHDHDYEQAVLMYDKLTSVDSKLDSLLSKS